METTVLADSPAFKCYNALHSTSCRIPCNFLAKNFTACDRAVGMQENSADAGSIVLMPDCDACMYKQNKSQKPR